MEQFPKFELTGQVALVTGAPRNATVAIFPQGGVTYPILVTSDK